MGFPAKKSRKIVVNGHAYRWLVTKVDVNAESKLLVEYFAQSGQKAVYVSKHQYSNRSVLPFTPSWVQAFITHALSQGWQPTQKGTERFFNDFHFLPPRVSQLPNGPVAAFELSFAADLDALRVKYPWKHYHNVIAQFSLDNYTTDIQLGTLVATWAQHNGITPGTQKAAIFERLAALEIMDAQEGVLTSTYYVRGGVQLYQEGTLVMDHGCCMALYEWLEWKNLLTQGSRAWNGHDPNSGAEWAEGCVRFVETLHPAGCCTVEATVYQKLVDQLEQDLQKFLARLEQWLQKEASPSLAARLVANVAATNCIEPG